MKCPKLKNHHHLTLDFPWIRFSGNFALKEDDMFRYFALHKTFQKY